MIDAYEIGIQLALQDDVSAGLQVISRELAEVDRAIEATSAKLSNLANAAQTAAGTAAAGVTMRPAAAPGQNPQETQSALEPEPTRSSTVDSGSSQSPPPSSAPVPATAEATAVTVFHQVVPPASPEPSKSGSDTQDVDPAISASVPRLMEAVAPTTAQLDETPEPLTQLNTVAPEVPRERSGGAVTAEPAGPTQPSAPTPARTLEPSPAGGDAPMQREKAFTASLVQATAPSRAYDRGEGGSTSPVRTDRTSTEPVGNVTAPWSGVGTRELSPRPAAASEGPAAPQVREREQTDGPGGTVMLDGHLVGYWLAEQMAKEASRPPSGTSFFDPRQTPAWTASGSL